MHIIFVLFHSHHLPYLHLISLSSLTAWCDKVWFVSINTFNIFLKLRLLISFFSLLPLLNLPHPHPNPVSLKPSLKGHKFIQWPMVVLHEFIHKGPNYQIICVIRTCNSNISHWHYPCPESTNLVIWLISLTP